MQQGFFSVQQTCSVCSGTGQVIKDKCRTCGGMGAIKENKTLSVNIPAGVDNGDKVRLSGEGEWQKGGQSGDLYVAIRVLVNPLFERDGKDLYIEALRQMGGKLYNRVLEVSGKQIFLDKTPRYYLIIPELKKIFPEAKFLNLYGSTEAGTLLSAEDDIFTVKEGMEGQIRIEANQIHVHRDLLGSFAGYPVDDDWYATGDMVEVVSEEPLRFRILHRDNDLINVGGYKVNPAEVEAALRALDGVHDARVYAQANSVMENIVCCDLVPAGTAISEKEIRQQLAEALQAFKIPRIFTFVENLDQTRTGKLKRT